MFRRFLKWLFKGYQLMLLEPEGGKTARNIHINIASLLAIIMLLAAVPAALVFYYSPAPTQDLSARYFQLQQQNHALRDQLATGQGELAVARGQIDGLKQQILESEQQIEKLKQSQGIYESILEARKAKGVRILRASAQLQDDDETPGQRRLVYSIVLVKGGNYPRSVSGSVLVSALGPDGQKKILKLGGSSPALDYHMETHTFLEGNVIWKQDWMPVKLHLTRLNSKGAERDQMEIELDEKPTN